MRIQHNISALNSWGKLGINQNNAAKNLEKLSSGYRINRAGDDAAGLAISEKMRAQIRGLDMASKNAQDGISLIQTAEGALDETHSILQRMRELAVQSANGTYQEEDRANTDLEIQALKSELDRIASSTHFNKIQLLDGSLSSGATKGTAGKAAANVEISDMVNSAKEINAATKGIYSTKDGLSAIQDGNTNEYTFSYIDENGKAASTTVTLKLNGEDGKIYGANGEVLKDTGSTGIKSASESDVAEALKSALEKSNIGDLFKIEVGTGASGNGTVTDGLKFTAKMGGTKAPVFTNLSQMTGPGSSAILGSGTVGNKDFVLDFSSVDVSKIKAGDTLSIGSLTFTFTDTAGFTTGSDALGTISLDEIKGGAASLVAALQKAAVTHGSSATATMAISGKAGATFDIAPGISSTEIKLTFGASLSASDLSFAADQQGVMTQIKHTPKSGIQQTGGAIGTGIAVNSFGRVEDQTAMDRYESYDMQTVGVWDGTEDDNIEDHVFTVDGKKFLFVKDNSQGQDISDTNLAKAVAKYGNDINVVSVVSTTLNAGDVVKMAERIKEKTSTNVVTDGTKLSFLGTPGTSGTAGEGKLVFQIGANGDADQRVSLSIDDMSSAGIGVDAVNILTADSANAAIDIVDKAINTVSATRASLGAMQNRLEHTINSLNTTSENLTAAESRIRDVDMAKEMMAFTKNNILTQAAQAMLAQANQQPQGVLQLLQ